MPHGSHDLGPGLILNAQDLSELTRQNELLGRLFDIKRNSHGELVRAHKFPGYMQPIQLRVESVLGPVNRLIRICLLKRDSSFLEEGEERLITALRLPKYFQRPVFLTTFYDSFDGKDAASSCTLAALDAVFL